MPTTYEAGAIVAGSTNLSLLVPLPVSTAHNAAGVGVSYTRAGAAPVAGTPASITPTGAHVDWGLVPVDATNLPELHRVDLPDAAFAPGADSLTLTVKSTALDAQHFTYRLSVPSRMHGVVTVGATTTSVPTTLSAGTNQLARRLLEVLSGAAVGQRVAIVANAAGTLEVAPPLTVAPAEGDVVFVH